MEQMHGQCAARLTAGVGWAHLVIVLFLYGIEGFYAQVRTFRFATRSEKEVFHRKADICISIE